MATRIAVMNKGAIEQVATPQELYEKPESRFVADFIGKVNLFEASVIAQKGKTVLCDTKSIGKIELQSDKPCAGNVTIAVRPEKLKLSKTKPKGANLIKTQAKVRDVAYFGDWSEVVADMADGNHLSVNVQNDSREGGSGVSIGDKIWVNWQVADSLLLTE